MSSNRKTDRRLGQAWAVLRSRVQLGQQRAAVSTLHSTEQSPTASASLNRLARRANGRLVYPPWRSAFSKDALRRAWLAIEANGGGGQGESLAEFAAQADEQLAWLQADLLKSAYRPKSVKQVLVPKGSGGWRPITLWSIRDRVAQRAVYNYLEPVWEARFLNCSYGFRRGRSTKLAAEAISVAHEKGYHWVFDADIKDCFGSMQDARLLRLLADWQVPGPLQHLIASWLQARIHNAWRGRATAGTSQGGVLSPLLCNLYLHSFDRAIVNRGWELVRYADDFVVMVRRERELVSAEKHITHTLGQLGLNIHPTKTRKTSFDAGFQFVGWFFIRGERFRLKG